LCELLKTEYDGLSESNRDHAKSSKIRQNEGGSDEDVVVQSWFEAHIQWIARIFWQRQGPC
jgi:hypothetical protein